MEAVFVSSPHNRLERYLGIFLLDSISTSCPLCDVASGIESKGDIDGVVFIQSVADVSEIRVLPGLTDWPCFTCGVVIQ